MLNNSYEISRFRNKMPLGRKVLLLCSLCQLNDALLLLSVLLHEESEKKLFKYYNLKGRPHIRYMSSKNSDITKGKLHTQYTNNKNRNSYATTDVLDVVIMTTGVCHDMTQ